MSKQEINHINSLDVNIEDATPVIGQYLEIKRENQDKIVLFRLGDFYETFFEDALVMSKELELTLTGKEAGAKLGRIPLAGIPAKSVDVYLEKLVKKGYKIAIAEQMEAASAGKALVKRDVIRVVTNGTLIEGNLLESTSNNYLCAIFEDKKSGNFGFAYTDISTGEFRVSQGELNLILAELARVKPAEIVAPSLAQKVMPFQIVPDEKIDLPDEITKIYNCSKIPASVFEKNLALNNLQAVFKTNSLESFGYENYKIGFLAAGALVAYVYESLKDNVPKFDTIQPYELAQYVLMDVSTRKNLELTETLREKNKYGSLLWAIDKTKTNMGARLLKSWICQPLKNIDEINSRQTLVEKIMENPSTRTDLTKVLSRIFDIERLATRLSNNSANPRDFLALKDTLLLLPEFLQAIKGIDEDLYEKVAKFEAELTEFAQIVDRTISNNAPITIKEGGVINEGVNGELDYLKDILTKGDKWIVDFEEREKEKTGIKFLKAGYNRIFGYFIEISNSNLDMVPNNYIRKQTLTGAERFITDELKKYEDERLSAQVKSQELEYKLFCDLKNYSKEYVTSIRDVANIIAKTDVLNSFAAVALENNYTKPTVDESDDFIIKNGRHAVLELILPLGAYVANDIELSAKSTDTSPNNSENITQFMILTGPNMAGKSTFMRQNALIAILAQIGSFVPADFAKIGVVDKIFTRVGASDDLTLGQSTFMVEMIETAYILNSATNKSLILLDEIGRGTSTYDGVAIAWAVAEHIAVKIQARTIFATHYHELNVMTNTHPQIKNFRITISEESGQIEFLRKIVQGGASKSYGIQVAKMAGLPIGVIDKAQNLMTKMQKDYSSNLSTKKKLNEDEIPQLNLF